MAAPTSRPPLYPLRFEPIFKNNLWGGQRLPAFLNRTHASESPIGEAWVLSDVDGSGSRISNGPLAGTTFRDLLTMDSERILGMARLSNGRFPLLLKFIDARQELSVQVHPNDEQAAAKHPNALGKTEAWVILEANPATSRIYSGFQPGMTAARFQEALAAKTAPATLHSFTPQPGDCVFLEAGTVHAIGTDILLFEVQQTSDITYRLYDWDRVDANTGLPREMHVADGLAVANFSSGPCPPVGPSIIEEAGLRRERLIDCRYFTLDRISSDRRFTVGAPGQCRMLIVLETHGPCGIEWNGNADALTRGEVILIPAEVGPCSVTPVGTMTVLECGLPPP
ncbi:MAG TPA: type I phosphomannose isomerase catalytic subunit [Gemmataceae bacterium]|jgi:mannose-6-phosphate isomerase